MPRGPLNGFNSSVSSLTGYGWNPGLGVGKRPDQLSPRSPDEWICKEDAGRILKIHPDYFGVVARKNGLSQKRVVKTIYYKLHEVEGLRDRLPKRRTRKVEQNDGIE